MARFIHTSDWHLGKPFSSIEDPEKRTLVREARFAAIRRVGALVEEREAEFVVVAGDLFDSPTPTRETVSAAMSAIGSIPAPVYAIPGNHDHAGPGAVWSQSFFAREREELAPNFNVLLDSRCFEAAGALIFPAPLAHRQLASDPTAWFRSAEAFSDAGDRVRIALAHGSIQGFSSDFDEEGLPVGQPNFLDLERLPVDELDYIALGDWHGAMEVSSKAWYSGTPEPDRFPKGEEHQQGQALLVDVDRGGPAEVARLQTNRLNWHINYFRLDSDLDLASMVSDLDERLGGRAREDLLQLNLSGSLGVQGRTELDRRLKSLDSRLLRVKVRDEVQLNPSPEDLASLEASGTDPLISSVASRLAQMIEEAEGSEERPVAERALRDLFLATER